MFRIEILSFPLPSPSLGIATISSDSLISDSDCALAIGLDGSDKNQKMYMSVS
jgi:hypothetical protein